MNDPTYFSPALKISEDTASTTAIWPYPVIAIHKGNQVYRIVQKSWKKRRRRKTIACCRRRFKSFKEFSNFSEVIYSGLLVYGCRRKGIRMQEKRYTDTGENFERYTNTGPLKNKGFSQRYTDTGENFAKVYRSRIRIYGIQTSTIIVCHCY